MLADRVRRVLHSLISLNQSAFVPNRIIGDNIMLAQSLCRDYHFQLGPPRCALKLDIHKPFDSLNWGFLFVALDIMGFPSTFIYWIKTCLQSAMISLKINGSLEGYFPAKSRLRQGDPLSPSLFVLAMEVFSTLLKEIARKMILNFT